MKKVNKKSDKKPNLSQSRKTTKSPVLAKDRAKTEALITQDESQTSNEDVNKNDKKIAAKSKLKGKSKANVKAKTLVEKITKIANEPEVVPQEASNEEEHSVDTIDVDAEQTTMSEDSLINQIEAVIFSSSVPLSLDKIMQALEDMKPALGEVRECLETLQQHYQQRGVNLVEVASGWRFQVSQKCAPTIIKTLVEKPSRLSRALLETLALIAYRQPITRAEIEAIRGVVVSTHMIKTLLDHEWIRVVGHKDVPGKPALYATTKIFLDDMGLKKLDELPPLSEIKALIPQEAPAAPQSLEEISELMAEASLVEEEIEEQDEMNIDTWMETEPQIFTPAEIEVIPNDEE